MSFSFFDKFTVFNDNNKKSKILNYILIFIGILFIIFAMLEFSSQSDKIADNVLFGETAVYGVLLLIFGLIIIFATIFIRFSFKTPLDKTFNDIKNFEINKSPSESDENNDSEKDNENIENKRINNKEEKSAKFISENLKNKSKKIKDKKIITRNIKTVFNNDKIKNLENSITSTKKTESQKQDKNNNQKIKKIRKNRAKKQNKKDDSASVSFDDAMESIDDLIEE